MLQFNFSPFPVLETERLLLREVTPDDIHTFYEMRSDERVMRYVDRPRPKNLDDLLPLMEQIIGAAKENKDICWAIELKGAPGVMIGQVGFWRSDMENHRGEVGYMLKFDEFGKGYASEAVEAAVNYGFNEMNFNTIQGCIAPENTGSARVLEKMGFKKEAYFREDYIFEGVFKDTVIYCGLQREWKK